MPTLVTDINKVIAIRTAMAAQVDTQKGSLLTADDRLFLDELKKYFIEQKIKLGKWSE